MKLNTAQRRRFEHEVEALELSGLDCATATARVTEQTERRLQTNKRRNRWRTNRDALMRDAGLVKGKDSMERTLWE